MELGLNVYQVIQNELITREGSRQSIGLGFRLAILEAKADNAKGEARNSRIWKLNHAISPIKAFTPESRRALKAQERKLLNQKDRNKHRDTKDPTMFTRDCEIWDICEWFPRTLLEFKELQFSPGKVRDMMEFYEVKAYTPNQRLIDVHPEDGLRDVSVNLETCMEELAMHLGLNWQRIDGMKLPAIIPTGPPAMHAPSPPSPNQYRSPPPRSTGYS